MYHFSVKTFSRSRGQSATAAIAYRAAAVIKCERTGMTYDYSKKAGVEHSEIFLPPNAPDFYRDRQNLWNGVEAAEKRKNSTCAREFEIAFPHQLNAQQRVEMLRELCAAIVDRHSCVADASIHAPHVKNGSDVRNYHAHILLSTRRLGSQGFTSKTRELDDKKTGSEQVIWWREFFANIANKHLKKAGYSTRIDHRSNKDRYLAAEPTVHEGAAVTAQRRRGILIGNALKNEQIKQRNKERISLHFLNLRLERDLVELELQHSAAASIAAVTQKATISKEQPTPLNAPSAAPVATAEKPVNKDNSFTPRRRDDSYGFDF